MGESLDPQSIINLNKVGTRSLSGSIFAETEPVRFGTSLGSICGACQSLRSSTVYPPLRSPPIPQSHYLSRSVFYDDLHGGSILRILSLLSTDPAQLGPQHLRGLFRCNPIHENLGCSRTYHQPYAAGNAFTCICGSHIRHRPKNVRSLSHTHWDCCD